MAYTVGGVKLKIKDIKNIHVFDEVDSKKAGVVKRDTRGNIIKEGMNSDRKFVSGMNASAYTIHKQNEHEMTNEELGISDKRIIIPSFTTTSKLFRQHFYILRELRHRIDLLKQAYEDQRAIDRSWD